MKKKMANEMAAVAATPIRPARAPDRRSFSTPATPYSAKGLSFSGLSSAVSKNPISPAAFSKPSGCDYA